MNQLDGRYFRGLEGKYDFDLHFILQEENAEAGDHIIRARGAWFGNRSISAEVDLEAGVYEVLPKIVASRDADATDVHEVVTKVAERNPQKLRQIGLNYDIANAKGVVELTDEEKKKKEQKKKEAAEKKKKEKEQEEKEKADFEAWKKEEKAEYEAWKKEKKERDEKEKPKEDPTKVAASKKEETEAAATAVITDFTKTLKEENAATEVSESKAKPTELAVRTKDPESKEEESTSGPKIEVDEASDSDDDDKEEGDDTPDDDGATSQRRGPRGPPSVASGVSAVSGRLGYGNRPESVYGGDVPPPPPPPAAAGNTDEIKPWNAVCVLGLRVYSKDSDVSIKLVKPKDAEEGAILDVDGDTPAGATM